MAYVPYSNYVRLHLSYVWTKQMGVIREHSRGVLCSVGLVTDQCGPENYVNARLLLAFMSSSRTHSPSQWPRGLRRGSAAARMLGLWVRIPPGAWVSFSWSVVCCQVEVSAPCWLLVQRSPAECGVSECDHESSIMRRAWPTGGCCTMVKKSRTQSTRWRSWLRHCSTSLGGRGIDSRWCHWNFWLT